MTNQQQTKIQTSDRPAHRKLDYINLFPGEVFPTSSIDVLERGHHLLFVKTYEWGKKMPPAQQKIWVLLARHGRTLEAPGTITIACVWGLGQARREFVVFDEQGKSEPRAATREEWRDWLLGWWDTHKEGR